MLHEGKYLFTVVPFSAVAGANVDNAVRATLTNTTVENDSERLAYTGHWDSNSSPVFSGGTTSYTNASGASVTLTFNGSAIYLFGDANNDHYAFNVTLDGVTTSHKTPLGCGGPFEPHACEKLLPGLQFFAAPLNSSEHTIIVTNWVVPSLNYSYFGKRVSPNIFDLVIA